VTRAALAGALAAVVAVVLAAGCGSDAHIEGSQGNSALGKDLFVAKCGGCHTLADAGTQGKVGPNLDEAFRYARNDKLNKQGIAESTIRDVVRGQISYPVSEPPTGAQGMPPIDETLPECEAKDQPAGCVDDPDASANDIAAYVASVAGLPVARATGAPGPSGGPAGAADGKAIFTSAGCVGCHTLKAAGATGTIGPNLDEAKPSKDLVVERVTNGKGPMPSFKGKLSEQQIQAVATFVSENAG
jgi:mono/diheme cytochrome c family protein